MALEQTGARFTFTTRCRRREQRRWTFPTAGIVALLSTASEGRGGFVLSGPGLRRRLRLRGSSRRALRLAVDGSRHPSLGKARTAAERDRGRPCSLVSIRLALPITTWMAEQLLVINLSDAPSVAALDASIAGEGGKELDRSRSKTRRTGTGTRHHRHLGRRLMVMRMPSSTFPHLRSGRLLDLGRIVLARVEVRRPRDELHASDLDERRRGSCSSSERPPPHHPGVDRRLR